ncbi:MAG: methyl-accepting chemotaxis protein, partial [Desulfobacterales bacterium]|nr:methyl-accepting chemotaxis protein [Desulfobacterales bacterium]
MYRKMMSVGIKIKFIGAFLIVAALAGVSGIVGYANVNRVGHEGINVGEKLAPLGDAAMEIKLTAANAHLIFEEIMGGDSAEDINAVWQLLDETLFYCDAIISGGENDEGTFFASTDPEVRKIVKDVRARVEKFIRSAHARYDNRTSQSGTGSGADQAFDASYESILNALDEIIDSHKDDITYMDPLLAAAQAKFYLADNHLFFEELLSGDDTIRMEDVLSGMATAKTRVGSMAVMADRSRVSQIQADIDKLINAAKERYKNNSQASTASHAVDAEFDKEYDTFIALADQAEEIIHDAMDRGVGDLKTGIKNTRLILISILAGTLIAAVLIGFFMSSFVSSTFKKCLHLSTRISAGDLTDSIDLTTLPEDETGALASELNTMSASLKEMIGKIKTGVAQLQEASGVLTDTSEQIEENSGRTTEKSSTVAAAAEEMNTNMNSVASATEQISSNIQMVASAAEEMIATIQEIAGNT